MVVPVFNEAANVQPLVSEVRDALEGRYRWELVFVDDGSDDETPSRIRQAIRRDGRIRLVRLARNYGQTLAMRAGFDESRADVVVSMDGDLQNDPGDIPDMIDELEQGYDLVAGYRGKRWEDEFLTRKLPSVAANWLIRKLTKIPLRDNGCSLKVYRRALVTRLPLYSDFHRFIAPMAASISGARISEVPVNFRQRIHGETKYGMSRVWRVLADLLTLYLIRSFRERPLLAFGLACVGATAVGLSFVTAAVTRILAASPPADGASLVFPLSALLWFGLALFLLMLGLVAEVTLRRRVETGRVSAPLVKEICGARG